MKKYLFFISAALLLGACSFGSYKDKTAEEWEKAYSDQKLEVAILKDAIRSLESDKEQLNSDLDDCNYNLDEKSATVKDFSNQLDDLTSQNEEVIKQNEEIQETQEEQAKYQRCLQNAKLFNQDSSVWCSAPSPY